MNVEFDVIIINIGANDGFRPFDDLNEEEIERNIYLNVKCSCDIGKVSQILENCVYRLHLGFQWHS